MKKKDIVPNIPDEPYKGMEFQSFLSLLTKEQYTYWHEIATALGVERHTITRWKAHPEAQKIINAELDEAIRMMKKVGSRDWRMWRERAKMLGITDKAELDITSGGKPIPIYGGKSTEEV